MTSLPRANSFRGLAVFIVYSHRDEGFKDELEAHLSALRRSGLVTTWTDRKILPGEKWDARIAEEMDRADIVLLLVSSDFLHSDYCFTTEMRRALERQSNGEAQVIPVILRDCDWEIAPLKALQALPKDARPISLWSDRDSALSDVARGVRRIVESVGEIRSDQATAPAGRERSIPETGVGAGNVWVRGIGRFPVNVLGVLRNARDNTFNNSGLMPRSKAIEGVFGPMDNEAAVDMALEAALLLSDGTDSAWVRIAPKGLAFLAALDGDAALRQLDSLREHLSEE